MPASNLRPSPDHLIEQIADYVLDTGASSAEAISTARYCLMDALGCAAAALAFPACTKILGPYVLGTQVPNGACVPFTSYQLDPIQASFNLGAMIRWLDYNDTFLAAEWGHPSDNLGGILSVADWLSRSAAVQQRSPLTVRDILVGMVQAYEIQGVLAIGNSFNRVGLDHVLLVKIATAAVTAHIMGADRKKLINALSNAWVDGQSLRTYRHAPNTGSRKSWAAGDASSRGVFLAWLVMRGETGYPSALTAPNWGFQDVLFHGKPVIVPQPFGSYVMENILFKVSFPAEFHGQTAVEAAIRLHPQVIDRLDEIEEVVITTQESAMRIIAKDGPLHSPADRDHCIQFMTAIGLIHGDLTAEAYEDSTAADPRIDALRAKTVCREDARYSREYLDPQKRSIANCVQVYFRDGTATIPAEVEYPLGHRRRRAEALPLLEKKFQENISALLSPETVHSLVDLFHAPSRLDSTPVDQFVDRLRIPTN
jgi:2-methylcitrate dehydratase